MLKARKRLTLRHIGQNSSKSILACLIESVFLLIILIYTVFSVIPIKIEVSTLILINSSMDQPVGSIKEPWGSEPAA